MSKFNVGDHIMDINSGQEYIVMSYDVAVIYGSSPPSRSEKYKLARKNDGYVFEVVDDYINRFCLSKDFLLSGFVPSTANSGSIILTTGDSSDINLDDIEMENVKLDYNTLKSQKYSRGCDHDWVTWTGLHGTQTDCSKCKEVRND